jgi:hypothetical protein
MVISARSVQEILTTDICGFEVSKQQKPLRKVNILGGHSIGHSKQKVVYIHVSYSERFPRYDYFTVQDTVHCTDEQHAMSSHELQSALMLTGQFSKMYYTR